MKLVTSEQMRELDRTTIVDRGVPGEILMERAGRAVAAAVLELAEVSGVPDLSVIAVAGCGNNGGDAFVAARMLAARGLRVDVLIAGDPGRIAGDSMRHFSRLREETAVDPVVLDETAGMEELIERTAAYNAAIDGVLGIGLRGAPEGASARAILLLNAVSVRGPVVAADVPSGMNADTGAAEGEVVRADVTVTMGLPKIGFVRPGGIELCGAIRVADIGIPPDLVEPIESPAELTVLQDVRGFFKRRRASAHKGDFGHVLIIGGCAGYSGAAGLAADAAVRSGAGLVSVFTPASLVTATAARAPEAMVHGMTENAEGGISRANGVADRIAKGSFDAVLIGPGMGRAGDTRAIVTEVLGRSRAPVVVDADAINALAGGGKAFEASCPVVMTPHPGEFARFFGGDIAAVQADRLGAAARGASEAGAVVVLKGAGTVVAAKGRPPCVNSTGNPGMSSGGTGDVLAGLLAGLLAQGMEPFDAARASAFVHGRAGDLAARRTCEAALSARDVAANLPAAMKEATPR